MLALGFSEDHQETLELFYKGKKQEIYDVLSHLTLDLPHYHDLEWRFEVQASSLLLLLFVFLQLSLFLQLLLFTTAATATRY